ncbi:MAG: FAD-binding protein [Deltaproteobacteria bacterium]|nr:FAD-binding protein [Deltaproteobacteria bacterium]
MSNHEGSLGENIREWPYPVNYGKENEVSADVLILGGGLAGCHAAINAARKGAKVVVVEKGAVRRSGSGGAGIDHWHDACTNPCCKISPEEMIESGAAQNLRGGPYGSGNTAYIACQEGYDALLDLENAGMKFRDEDNEFAGAEFRDEETKMMFAYDYVNNHTIRLRQGAEMKPVLYKELKRLNVEIYDRVMVTSLLTEGGKQGARVIGATGVNTRTGEFYVFKAKATVLSTAGPSRMWIFNTELKGSNVEHGDPNCTGEGHVMAWQAGAEFNVMEEAGGPGPGGPFGYPAYGIGGWHNTWYPCSIVDANGKEVPWVDRDGRVLKTVSERTRPAPGQKFFVLNPGPSSYEVRHPSLIPDLPERVRKGEFVLPFYADLPGMPEHERRAIFGLMVGNEGKTRIAIYENYTGAGFDPEKDMLQAYGMGFERGSDTVPQWRTGGGRIVVDWDLKSNLEGLYAAGQLCGGGGCAGASTTGRYAGRKAADYAQTAGDTTIDRRQVDEEKIRVYAPLKQKGDIGWKELHAGICRIMQDYCGEYKGEETLKMGLRWLSSIRESEAARINIRNPHELARTLECLVRITVGKMIMHACLARKASSKPLGFKRIDYPEMDPSEWNKFVTIRLENGEVKAGELPLNYLLLPPYAPTYKENYEQHCGL